MEDHLYLAHHGIKGMKWGVRRFQNDDGSLTAAGKQRYGNTSNVKRLLTSKYKFGSAERAEEKQKMFQAKIAKGGDRNIVTRNIVNDWRAGRAAQIGRKAEHRRAREAYSANNTIANKKRLDDARDARLVKNVAAAAVFGDTATIEGKYKRYRQNGKTVADSALYTAGGVILTGLAVSAASSAASGAVNAAVIAMGKNAIEHMWD